MVPPVTETRLARGDQATRIINRGELEVAPLDMAVNKRELPVTYLRPAHGWIALNLSALWAYRELVFFLTWRVGYYLGNYSAGFQYGYLYPDLWSPDGDKDGCGDPAGLVSHF